MPRIFIGKSPSDVVTTLPLIFSVCGVAQGCAAAEALEQALAIPVSPACLQRRRMLVALETVREHLWRIELDWAGFLNRSPVREDIARMAALIRDFRTTLFPEENPFIPGGVEPKMDMNRFHARMEELERLLEARVFSRPIHIWLEISDWAELVAWSRECDTPAQELLCRLEKRGDAGVGSSQVSALGELDTRYLNQRLTGADADCFIAQPDWQGAPAETTPFTRRRGHPMLRSLETQYGSGLLTRMTARLVESALLIRELRAGIICPEKSEAVVNDSDAGSGIGISRIEAARGRLVHRVELEAGLVSNYQILAPTEWNFHPRGVLVSAFEGLETDNEASLKQMAELLINAIDPCVSYQLRIDRSGYGAEPTGE